MSSFCRALCLSIFAGLYGMAAAAQSLPSVPGPDIDDLNLPENTLRAIASNPEQAMRNAITALYTFSNDGVINQAKLSAFGLRAQAQARTAQLSGIFVHDLDGDFTASAAEVETLRSILPTRELGALISLISSADKDLDGALSQAEIQEYVNLNQRGRASER